VPPGDVTPVTTSWLALWPAGRALTWDAFGISRAGQPVGYAGGSSGLPPQGRVGDIVTTPAESVLLAEAGPRPLDAFALAVLRNATIDGRPVRELRADRIGVARLSPDRSAHWPDSTLTQARGELCAELDTEAGRRIVAGLEHKYGAGLATDFVVNPALLGGVRVRVGSDVWDSSVRNRLERLQQKL